MTDEERTARAKKASKAAAIARKRRATGRNNARGAKLGR
jgi:hypothetical protein